MIKQVAIIALLIYSKVYSVELITITGKVLSKSETPLVGANIMVENSQIGTATDINGEYRLEIPSALSKGGLIKLKTSYIGYQSKVEQVAIPIKTSLLEFNFILETDVMKLESVVVIGMGVKQESRKLGVSIETVRKEQVENSPEVSLVSALRGNVPGLEIRKTSGDAKGHRDYFRRT